jgi:hypothetical protein
MSTPTKAPSTEKERVKSDDQVGYARRRSASIVLNVLDRGGRDRGRVEPVAPAIAATDSSALREIIDGDEEKRRVHQR